MDANSPGGHGGSGGSGTTISGPLGQATSSASIPVVIASDQTLGISGSVSASGSVSLIPLTTGGVSSSCTIWPNNTTAVVVKASPGQVYGVHVQTNSTALGYLKMYDATSATAGSGTPKLRVICPAPAVGGFLGGFMSDTGVQFSTGISIILTGAITDADTTAVAANTFIVTVFYK